MNAKNLSMDLENVALLHRPLQQ
ncbi:hypothetical protein LINPERPRIM_LOCUS2336 [Linum perenne]